MNLLCFTTNTIHLHSPHCPLLPPIFFKANPIPFHLSISACISKNDLKKPINTISVLHLKINSM